MRNVLRKIEKLVDEPVLVRLDTIGASGPPGRVRCFLWSTGRVGAALDPAARTFRLERFFGHMTDEPITISVDELDTLIPTTRDWTTRRKGWGGFSSSGSPRTSSLSYQPPGEGGRIQLYRRDPTGAEGEGPQGQQVQRPPANLDLPPGVEVEAALWWVGDPFVPTEGAPHGLRYPIGDGLHLDGTRFRAHLEREGGGEVYLEPRDVAFLEALRVAVRQDGAPEGSRA